MIHKPGPQVAMRKRPLCCIITNSDMVKSYNNLYDKICDFENIHLAYLKARKNKRYRADVLSFSARLEGNLSNIQSDLINGTYCPGSYRTFCVYEPKKRTIMSLPFGDRVIHHAICNVIEPIFEGRFIHDSYACRVGKGIHKASDRLVSFLNKARQYWGDSVYCLKGDIRQYFPSINHTILRQILSNKIRCPKTMSLLIKIISSHNSDMGTGIPIGNLTSQLFANVYLNELDRFIKQRLRIKYYLRYMDDFIVLDRCKAYLHWIKMTISSFIDKTLQLKLNSKSDIFPARQGINFVGYKTWHNHRFIKKQSIKRIIKKYRGMNRRGATITEVRSSIASWTGYFKHTFPTWEYRKLLTYFDDRGGCNGRTSYA